MVSNDILIVDDTPENLRLLGAMLHDRGYKVRPVTSGLHALKACAAQPPDIVLLDINMPEMNGYEVCARLKSDPRLKDIPVLFISALADIEDKVKAFRMGGEDYITKPFQAEEVEARVAAHLSLHRQKQELASIATELRIRNEATEEDLSMARELQSALLPHHFPRFPRDAEDGESNIHFSHLYRPSASLSGDLFDVFEIADNMAGVFICDVMGHGVRAALVASILRTLVGTMKPYWKHPSVFMAELNRALTRTLRNSRVSLFASAFYAVVDMNEGCMIFANAGHPWPLRVRSGCQPQTLRGVGDCKSGVALGLLDEAVYIACRTEIAAPETILFFTDGIFEVEAGDGTLYDYQALCTAIGELADIRCDSLCEEVVRKVRQFSERSEFADDVCLVAMEIDHLGAPAVQEEPVDDSERAHTLPNHYQP